MIIEYRKNAGKMLRVARKELGWSQEKFAAVAIVSDQTIKNAEAGKPITCTTHKKLVDTINRARAISVPPVASLVLPYLPMAPEALASSPASTAPTPSELDNPCLAAIHEALREYAPSHDPKKLRLGDIRSPAELHDLWSMDNVAYGDASITFEHFQELWNAFPLGLRVLFFENTIIGAIGIWPLSGSWARALKAARVRERELPGRTMRAFRQKPARYWYISGIVRRSELTGGRTIKPLLSKGINSWLNTAKIRYPCELFALASAPAGHALLERFGFFQVQKADAMPDGYPLYGLAVNSRAEFVQLLKERNLDLD
jgi:DNA-binding XRE family transcriptional regulator